jgi:hypothetical protein
MTARLAIRSYIYRGTTGFLVYGRGAQGHRVSVFATTRTAAERIRDKLRAGEEIGVADFAA